MITKHIYIEFDNEAPDTVEIRPVNDMRTDISFPDEAVKFQFVVDNRPDLASPTYYIGHEFGSIEEMVEKYPNYADHITHLTKRAHVQAIGKMEWDYWLDGQQYTGYMLVPLIKGVTVLIKRDTKEIIWS